MTARTGGLRWTFWYVPAEGPAMALVPSRGATWAPRYAVRLWDVAGCLYVGQFEELPGFDVPGQGFHVLTLEQAWHNRIVRMTELEAGSGGVRAARERLAA